jgi:hypothetical protein
MKNTKTLYMRYGDYFILIAFLVLAVAVITGWRRGSVKKKIYMH